MRHLGSVRVYTIATAVVKIAAVHSWCHQQTYFSATKNWPRGMPLGSLTVTTWAKGGAGQTSTGPAGLCSRSRNASGSNSQFPGRNNLRTPITNSLVSSNVSIVSLATSGLPFVFCGGEARQRTMPQRLRAKEATGERCCKGNSCHRLARP